MKKSKRPVRLWAVFFWILCWQGVAMAMAAAYPAGHLLLASPLASLRRLGALALTGDFWAAVGTSAVHIFGGFAVSCVLAVVLAALSARFAPVRGSRPCRWCRSSFWRWCGWTGAPSRC